MNFTKKKKKTKKELKKFKIINTVLIIYLLILFSNIFIKIIINLNEKTL